MGHAIARQRQFNPRDFRDDVHDLARVNPELLAKQVTALARKKNAADGMLDIADGNTSMVFGTGLAILATGLVGGLAGTMNADRDAMVAEWESQGNSLAGSARCTPWEMGVKDPTILFWKIPKLALAPILSLIGWSLVRSRRRKHKGKRTIPGTGEVALFGTFMATTGLVLADAMSNHSYCKAERQITSGVRTIDITPKVAV